MPSNGGCAGRPAGSGSPIGRIPQDRSRLPNHTGVDGDLLTVDRDDAAPGPQLREPLRVQSDPVAGPEHVPLFLHDVEQPVPGEIDGDALGLLEDHPQLVQRFGDLDAVAVHALVEPVLVDAVAQMHRGLGVAATDQHERVLHPEVGVVPDAGDQEDVAGSIVGVEVGAVVEVAVRGARPRDRLRNLVYGKLVGRSEHHAPSPMSRLINEP